MHRIVSKVIRVTYEVTVKEHSFSNFGTRTASGTPTVLFWYVALIKEDNIHNVWITVFANKRPCHHYITQLHCQPVFQISDVLFKCKKCLCFTEIDKFYYLEDKEKVLVALCFTPAVTLERYLFCPQSSTVDKLFGLPALTR